MPETCRTCEWLSKVWRCDHEGEDRPNPAPWFHCDDYEKEKETRLVDELAEALARVLQQFSNEEWPCIAVAKAPARGDRGVTWTSLPVDDQTGDALRHGRQVYARYQEEVSNV